MRIDRLIGILAILLQRDRVTAPELAAKFEVSKRTINRDIDALTRAGVPLYTTRGTGGGISVVSGYRIDRTLLTSKDMKSILAGLRSLDSVSGSHYYEILMEKLQTGANSVVNGRDYMLIDLSSWYHAHLTPKLTMIEEAIEKNRLLTFAYVSQTNEGMRTVEPYFVVFRWSNWYVWGWSLKDDEFRLYKVNRMSALHVDATRFDPRTVPMPEMKPIAHGLDAIHFTALFDPSVKWRILDEFSADQLQPEANGKLRLTGAYSDSQSLVQWLLSFGDKVELLQPVAARKLLQATIQNMLQTYQR
ncbi:helix-turn-helix transcriptional regulator [Lacticaseibacillus salsurivasis]|uniref:helix-turn-helix transcriptional regulator n=1 Tax=Lacticaseibacillus salsurivasis TaxID=3081441 RepID=UPI0030C6DD74